MFAEFEKTVHMKHKNGEPLTADILSNIYYDLNKKYFEAEVNVDEEYPWNGQEFPILHQLLRLQIRHRLFIRNRHIGHDPKRRTACSGQIHQILKSGSSDYPLELLKIAGVDLSTPNRCRTPWMCLKKSLGNLKRLYSSIYPISTRVCTLYIFII